MSNDFVESPSFADGVPRVYPRSLMSDEGIVQFDFSERYVTTSPSNTLLFTGQYTRPASLPEPVIIKLLYTQFRGRETQMVLAESGLAPKLHEVLRLDGLPHCIIMEQLLSEWWSLTRSMERDMESFVKVKEPLRQSLKDVLAKLEAHGMVHGDLRPNNIFIKWNETDSLPALDGSKAAIKVIDFDWSGRLADSLTYPLCLNPHMGYDWPRAPGTVIRPGDDLIMIQNWWRHFFSGDFF
jgi:serine/threonine protein kinase